MSNVKQLPDVAEENAPKHPNFIPRVGISNFEMPVCGHLASIDSYVSLEADKKGISMSRIPLALYATNGVCDFYEFMDKALRLIQESVGTDDVYLKMSMRLPFEVESLVSKLKAHKYYGVSFEARKHGVNRPIDYYLTLVMDYSSACPCSQALSEDWMNNGEEACYAVPHSQRSEMKVTVKIPTGFDYKQLVYALEERIATPTQVLVKREDEQMFAVLNGRNPKFVEDAVRALHDLLDNYESIEDFAVVVEHQESLHPHNVLAVSYKGIPNGLR